MLHLIIMMIERVGIIVILGVCACPCEGLSQSIGFIMKGFEKRQSFVFIFASFSIISNCYHEIEIQQQMIMNHEFSYHLARQARLPIRESVGIEMGGLIGGPFVGIGAGLLGLEFECYSLERSGTQLCDFFDFSGCHCRLCRE
ncbi:hypothetical protein ACEQPO_21465 [Bacillus sp. SL00103]